MPLRLILEKISYVWHSVSPEALAAQCFICNYQLNGNHCGSWFARERMTCWERAILLPPVRKISTPPLSGSILSAVGEQPVIPRHAPGVNEQTNFKQ